MTNTVKEQTLPQLFLRNSQRWPSKIAMRKKNFGIWEEYTWQQCYQEVKHLSLGLVSLGLQSGDKVAIIGDSEPEWCWAELAAQSAGAIVVGLFTDAIASEVKYVLNHSESKIVFAKDQEQVDKVLDIKGEVPSITKVIYWDPSGLWGYDDPILTSLDTVLEMGAKYEQSHPDLFEKNIAQGKGEDLCLLSYTSGTTGVPKAIMVGHGTVIGGTKKMASTMNLSADDDLFSVYPPAWMAEQVSGIGMHCVTGMALSFAEEPETMQEDIREISPKMLGLGPRQLESMASMIQVKIGDADALKRLCYRLFLPLGYKNLEFIAAGRSPTLFWKILHTFANWIVFRPLRDYLGVASKTKYVRTGGTALSPDVFRLFHALGVILMNAYGCSEGGGFNTGHRVGNIRLETVGPPAIGVDVRISDEGEILLSGDNIVSGYYKDPELTQKAFRKGWFYTGDAGVFTELGHLVFLDRVSELGELAGGQKYSPSYIEGKLKFSPYIKDLAVIGGKQRDYVSAVINIDFDNVGKWAMNHRIPYTTFVDLSQKQETCELIRKDIERVNKVLPEQSQVRKYILLNKEFDPDEGELTRTRKLRRGYFDEKYRDLIDAIYQDKKEVMVETVVKYRDGRTSKLTTAIRIESL